MNIFIPKTLITILLLSLVGIFLMAFSKTESNVATTYKAVRITSCGGNWLDWDCIEKELNELSKKGWTVVSVTTECTSMCIAVAVVK